MGMMQRIENGLVRIEEGINEEDRWWNDEEDKLDGNI